MVIHSKFEKHKIEKKCWEQGSWKPVGGWLSSLIFNSVQSVILVFPTPVYVSVGCLALLVSFLGTKTVQILLPGTEDLPSLTSSFFQPFFFSEICIWRCKFPPGYFFSYISSFDISYFQNHFFKIFSNFHLISLTYELLRSMLLTFQIFWNLVIFLFWFPVNSNGTEISFYDFNVSKLVDIAL